MLTLWNNHVHRFFLHRLQLSRPHSRFSVRSALTDAPVASFTTLLLRAAQHATGLMVKVARLLPPKDLLSSQRQLYWTHTKVFAIAGARCKSSSINYYQQQFQRDVSNLAFVYILIYSFSISGSSGWRFSNALPSQILTVVCHSRLWRKPPLPIFPWIDSRKSFTFHNLNLKTIWKSHFLQLYLCQLFFTPTFRLDKKNLLQNRILLK